ncbi:Sporulation initiation inhibitor protein soj [Lacticaseibacillus paracasei]|uniref:ParA family protein n=1 Tax=Lacticaseibacillus paracasei TaxID=1597 RepID=UPI000F0B21E8|nr:AAA family ATPase [Lacticaseibacillus paracasei]RNE43395.1 Sporulation initiation inhibitor protein soj [Lacticaseibacillus paracasei]
MAKVVAFSSNKGGVLKTSLAINVAGLLATQGKKTLIIDMDNQGNVATSFGKDPDQYEMDLGQGLRQHLSIKIWSMQNAL